MSLLIPGLNQCETLEFLFRVIPGDDDLRLGIDHIGPAIVAQPLALLFVPGTARESD